MLIGADQCMDVSRVRWVKDNVPEWKDCIVVSPDAGGAKRSATHPTTGHLPAPLVLTASHIHMQCDHVG